MNIAVFGMGYVGCVTAACMADGGHQVTGVDKRADKVALINSGLPTVEEPGLAELVTRNVEVGRLCATINHRAATERADMIMVCVGTPHDDGRDVWQVSRQVGEAIANRGHPHESLHHTGVIVALRSTMLPEVMHKVVKAQIDAAAADVSYWFCANPEFLREGSAVADFMDPPFIVVGGQQGPVKRVERAYREARVEAQLYATTPHNAMMLKYACNAFHAVKVVFANEMRGLCNAQGANAASVMGAFVADRRLNMSGAYLQPGTPFGGPCLPKDLITLLGSGGVVRAPMLQAALDSNAHETMKVAQVADTLAELQPSKARVLVVGASFKEGTPDTRGSHGLLLVEALLARDVYVVVWDEAAQVRTVPSVPTTPRIQEALKGANVVILTRLPPPTVREAIVRSQLPVLDPWGVL